MNEHCANQNNANSHTRVVITLRPVLQSDTERLFIHFNQAAESSCCIELYKYTFTNRLLALWELVQTPSCGDYFIWRRDIM